MRVLRHATNLPAIGILKTCPPSLAPGNKARDGQEHPVAVQGLQSPFETLGEAIPVVGQQADDTLCSGTAGGQIPAAAFDGRRLATQEGLQIAVSSFNIALSRDFDCM